MERQTIENVSVMRSIFIIIWIVPIVYIQGRVSDFSKTYHCGKNSAGPTV